MQEQLPSVLDLQLSLPTVLKSVLERDYFDDAKSAMSYFKADLTYVDSEPLPECRRIARIGVPIDGDWSKVEHSIQQALSSCHLPDVLKICYFVDYDGYEISLSIGVKSADERKADSEQYLDNLLSIFRAGCPGVSFQKENECGFRNRTWRCVSPMTGIPSENQGRVGMTESLVSAMEGTPFSLVICASPISSEQIEASLFACREMLSKAETFRNVTSTMSKSLSEQISYQYGQNKTKTTGISDTVQNRSAGRTAAAAAAAVVGACVAPELGPLMLIAANGFIKGRSESRSESESAGWSASVGGGISVSESEGVSVNVVNAHIEEAAKYLRTYAERLLQGKMTGTWDTQVYLMTETPSALKRATSVVKALYSGPDSYIEPIRALPEYVASLEECDLQRLSAGISRGATPEWRMRSDGHYASRHPLGLSFSSLSTPLASGELVRWLGMPRSDLNGISIVPWSDGFAINVRKSTKGLKIGSIESAGGRGLSFSLNSDVLARHALVAGVTRSGKSNTCRRLLNEVRKSKGKDFPFMVIEPAKTEYLEWALRINEKAPGTVNVFMPGRTSYRSVKHLPQLKINPFELIWLAGQERPDVAAHIQHLTPIINAVLPMQESLPLLMEEAIYDCYAEPTYFNRSGSPREGICQWIPVAGVSKFPNRSTLYPTFKTLGEYAEKVVERKKYHNEANMGFTAAMRTRVNSFCYAGLPRGMTFNSDGKPHPEVFEDLFTKPTVINLSAVTSDDEKAFFMAVLFMFLYEYRCAEFEIGRVRDNSLRHLLVLEEAHCILRNTSLKGAENINAVGKVSEMFSNIISEIGAYGQGIMIVDQSPERIAVDAVKNTNLKIIHRLQYGGDIQQMSVAMNLLPAQEQILSTLGCGEAVLRSDEDVKPFRLLIDHE